MNDIQDKARRKYKELLETGRYNLLDKVRELSGFSLPQDITDEHFLTITDYQTLCRFLWQRQVKVSQRCVQKVQRHFLEKSVWTPSKVLKK